MSNYYCFYRKFKRALDDGHLREMIMHNEIFNISWFNNNNNKKTLTSVDNQYNTNILCKI